MTPVTREVVAELRASGRAMAALPVADRVASIAATCADWRRPDRAPRMEAEAALAERYGVPREAIARVLDAGFAAWTEDGLARWIVSEIGDPRALDGFVPVGGGVRRAIGPELVVVLSAYGVPTTPIGDLIAALTVGAAVWLKPSSSGDDLAARFVTSLANRAPALGAAAIVSDWPVDAASRELVINAADVVVVTGGPDTITALRERVPASTRIVEHGARLSAAVIGPGALTRNRDRIVRNLATDVAFSGQLGCLSPVIAYVVAPFASVVSLIEPLQAACERAWPAPPRAAGSVAEVAAFTAYRSALEIDVAAGAAVAWTGNHDAGWTVVARGEPGPPEPPPFPRHVTLAAIDDVDDATGWIGEQRGRIATVGIAVAGSEGGQLADRMARVGVERIAPLGSMQHPPVGWRRDGRATLADLVRWVDRET